MASANGSSPKAVIFDLDEALLDARKAWQYTIEEAVLAVAGRRIDAAALVDEYRRRPWRDALAILVNESPERIRCEILCARMYERSGMKKLLVHDGLGMALDELRGRRVEIGAITRQEHSVALRQIESTGLDRFLTVLSPTPRGERWQPAVRLGECLSFLQRDVAQTAFVSPETDDLQAVAEVGAACFAACWCGEADGMWPGIPVPRELPRLVT